MKRRDTLRLIGFCVPIFGLAPSSLFAAEETLEVAIGQRGNWENSICELGQDAGFFKKHGIKLDLLYTEGSGQTQQAVIAGSVDIGIGVGTYGAMGAAAKGAPLKIIGSSMIGAHDLYWYAKAEGGIASMKEAGGKTVAYSTNGSSTNLVVLGLQKTLGVKFNPTATGSPASTYTQVMSGQIDVGWASPPFGVKDVGSGRIKIVARGSDVPEFSNQSVRVMIANARSLETKGEALGRFMKAYRETLDWLYSDKSALDAYATWAGTDAALARQVREEFYPKQNLQPDKVNGLDKLMVDAVTYKYLQAPLDADQLKKLVVAGTGPLKP